MDLQADSTTLVLSITFMACGILARNVIILIPMPHISGCHGIYIFMSDICIQPIYPFHVTVVLSVDLLKHNMFCSKWNQNN